MLSMIKYIKENNKYEKCSKCKEQVLSHRVCKCGYYKGKKITDGWDIKPKER